MTLAGIPRGLILAEKSRISEGIHSAIAAAHSIFPPWDGWYNDKYFCSINGG
jgi:hypothetical protein